MAVSFEPAKACNLQELQITWDRAGPAFEGRMDLGYTCSAGASEDGWSVAVLTNRFNIEDFLTWTEGTQDDPTELVGELLAHVAAEE